MFDVQVIPNNMNLKCQHLNLFGTCWPQELPVDHTVVHENNKNTWKK